MSYFAHLFRIWSFWPIVWKSNVNVAPTAVMILVWIVEGICVESFRVQSPPPATMEEFSCRRTAAMKTQRMRRFHQLGAVEWGWVELNLE